MKWSSLHGEFVSCFLVFPLSQFHSDLPETRDSRDVPFRGRRWILNLKLMWRKGAKSTWACEKILDKPGSPQNSLLRKEKLSILPTSSWNLGLYPHFRTNPLEKTTAEIASNSDWVCQILSIGYTKIHCVIMSFIIKKFIWSSTSPHRPKSPGLVKKHSQISHLVNIPDQSLFRKCFSTVARNRLPTGTLNIPKPSLLAWHHGFRPWNPGRCSLAAVAIRASGTTCKRRLWNGWDPMKPTETVLVLSLSERHCHCFHQLSLIITFWLCELIPQFSGPSNLNIFK